MSRQLYGLACPYRRIRLRRLYRGEGWCKVQNMQGSTLQPAYTHASKVKRNQALSNVKQARSERLLQ